MLQLARQVLDSSCGPRPGTERRASAGAFVNGTERVNTVFCMGGSADLAGFSEQQIYAELEALA
jgi:hypothetical protein